MDFRMHVELPSSISVIVLFDSLISDKTLKIKRFLTTINAK